MISVLLHYRNPSDLIDGSIYYGGPVITAQRQMAGVMRRHGGQAFDINSILEALLPDWYAAERRLEQFLIVSALADGLEGEESLGRAFRNNRSDVLRNIRTLAEIGMSPELMPSPESREMKAFAGIYREFWESPGSGCKELQESLDLWQDAESFRKLLAETPVSDLNDVMGYPEAVYFQGFHYVKPMQGRLMDAFSGLGIPVYMMAPHDPSDPAANEVWVKNHRFAGLEARTAFPSREAVRSAQKAPRVMQFEDIFSMVRYLRRNGKGTPLYAPITDELRDLLETFFPRHSGSDPTDDSTAEEKSSLARDEKLAAKENLLAYPAGRYLWGLYSMWDADLEDLVLNPETVRECLATGWAGSRCDEQCSALDAFDAVADFFSGCLTISDWKERLDRLRDAYEQVLPEFRTGLAEANSDRWTIVAATPLETIGAFSLSLGEAENLVATLEQMIEDARFLFGSTPMSINVLEHFGRIKKLLKEKAVGVGIRQEEKLIIRKFGKRLRSRGMTIETCSAGHLAEAMAFFLGGRMDGDEDDDASDGGISLVRSLADIESAYFLSPETEVHLCFCDDRHLPGNPRACGWPLSEQWFMRLLDGKELSIGAKLRVRDHLHYLQNSVLSSRYLFRLASGLPRLMISWVHVLKERELLKSVYISMLKRRTEESASMLLTQGELTVQGPPETAKKIQKEVLAVLPPLPRRPLEVNADLKLLACPAGAERIFYDYFLGSRPIYRSEFHLNFLLTGLICISSLQSRCSLDDAAAQVCGLYPAGSGRRIGECLAWARRRNKEIREFSGMDCGYPKERFFMMFLQPRSAGKLLSVREEESEEQEDDKKDYPCKYCPHGAYCLNRKISLQP